MAAKSNVKKKTAATKKKAPAKKPASKKGSPKKSSIQVVEQRIDNAPATRARVTREQRPLSPHLQVYKPQITSMLSIAHRITGAGLAVGSIILAAWLASIALGEEYYNTFMLWVNSGCGITFLMLFTLAFYYHLLNGIRHLFWDIGRGLELNTVTATGIATVIGALALTAFTWWSLISTTLFGRVL